MLSSSTSCMAYLSQCFIHDSLPLRELNGKNVPTSCVFFGFNQYLIPIQCSMDRLAIVLLFHKFIHPCASRTLMALVFYILQFVVFCLRLLLSISSPKMAPTTQTNSKFHDIQEKCAWTFQIPQRTCRRTMYDKEDNNMNSCTLVCMCFGCKSRLWRIESDWQSTNKLPKINRLCDSLCSFDRV